MQRHRMEKGPTYYSRLHEREITFTELRASNPDLNPPTLAQMWADLAAGRPNQPINILQPDAPFPQQEPPLQPPTEDAQAAPTPAAQQRGPELPLGDPARAETLPPLLGQSTSHSQNTDTPSSAHRHRHKNHHLHRHQTNNLPQCRHLQVKPHGKVTTKHQPSSNSHSHTLAANTHQCPMCHDNNGTPTP